MTDYELLFGPAACARGVAVDFDAARHARDASAPAAASVEASWAAARAANPRVFDGPKFRLARADARADGGVVLRLGLTGYRDYVATHRAAEWAELLARSRSNALGCEAALRTADGSWALLRRSRAVATHGGLWNGPSGHAEPARVAGFPGALSADGVAREVLVDAILDETVAELGVPRASLSAPRLVGAMADDRGKPDLLFLVETALSDAAVRAARTGAAEAWESDDLRLVAAPPDAAELTPVTRAVFACLAALGAPPH